MLTSFGGPVDGEPSSWNTRKKSNSWLWTVEVLILLPVLYVASFGPACWLADRQALPEGLADVIYGPLLSIAVYTGCDRALECYGTLVELPELPPDPEGGTDCRLYTAVRIRLGHSW